VTEVSGITDVKGIKVGHYTDLAAATGCTVILCEQGASAGVDVRGSAPGTRETALLNPVCLVDQVHAILLSGGSAFGLNAATGVVRYLEERGFGFDVAVARVPIVPAAVLFDLTIGRADVRPDAEAGYQACLAATSGPVVEGTVGAGTGATVGKILSPKFATKGGIGTASQKLGRGIVVGAIVAVNAFGDVVAPATNKIIAGARKPVLGGFADSIQQMKGWVGQAAMAITNTTIGVVATNAYLNKAQATKVAQMAHDGLAMAIRPVHTMLDGDTVFALATGKPQKNTADVTVIGAIAADIMAQAVVRAVQRATGLGGIPAASELTDKD
jgi:L-aminopeptidase/D-esterase-like protein